MTREELFKKRLDEFGFSPIKYLFSDKDDFPYRFHIVKWEHCEPMRVYSIDEEKYVERTSYNYAIAELEWDAKEPGWKFKSIGMRYLEESTKELDKWILDFTNNYYIFDGELRKCEGYDD